MKTLAKILCATLCALLIASAARADDKVTFEANAPMIVTVGEAFRVEFALNAKPESDSFTAPDFTDFDIIAGPATASGSSMQIINGSMSTSVSYTITYVLLPQKEGTFRIGSATIRAKGKSYTTQPTMVEVRAAGASQQQQQSAEHEQNRNENSRAQSQIGRDDILLRLTLSRSSVYKGEPIRAILKLYTRVSVVGFEEQKMPTFNGFWSQEFDTSQQQEHSRETINGKVYDTYNLMEYLLYPQQSGTLTIEPASLTAVAQVIVQNDNGFDPFFGGGREVYNVRRKLVTPRVNVNVKEFPAGAPASFNGAVGRYTLESSISNSSLAANSAATYTLKIAGSGNLNFVQAPTLVLPSSFEQYDVKTTESLKTTGSGIIGYRQFEYPFIARAEGDYTIAAPEFTYFSPEQAKYITLTAQPYALTITPDTSSGSAQQVVTGTAKEDVKMLGQDLRFIRLGRPNLHRATAPFMLSATYWLCIAAIVLLFALLFYVLRRQIHDRRNIVRTKGKRANKVAVQRFRAAARYMKEQNRQPFYDEMLRALWGYIGDKFNIPVANLTKESAREHLSARGATDEAAMFGQIISRCEEAQYSPVASAQMQEVYSAGIELVSRIESKIKR